MAIEFTSHNIRLDNGICTMPLEQKGLMDSNEWFVAARRILEVVFPGDKSRYRIADLGCLEGGFTVEFARMGFEAVGIDVRESNIAACRYVQENTNLPNLEFIKDDAWNADRHGPFDATFCCGLFYHLDRPRQFLQLLSRVTSKLLILQTHFATENPNPKYGLSDLCETDGLQGRWFTEYLSADDFQNRENLKWASWDNHRSFWVRREYLLQAIQDVGFDLVLEQFDSLGGDIVHPMTEGWYKLDGRGTFIGIKTEG